MWHHDLHGANPSERRVNNYVISALSTVLADAGEAVVARQKRPEKGDGFLLNTISRLSIEICIIYYGGRVIALVCTLSTADRRGQISIDRIAYGIEEKNILVLKNVYVFRNDIQDPVYRSGF